MKAIFLVLDTIRRDFMECYGNTWVHTPNLNRLAKGATIFDNHWVGSLPCMPARREFMTGRYNFLDRYWGPIEPFDDVLPTELREKKKVYSHIATDHYHYFELGGENYHTAFTTWDFHRGQENDPWVSVVDGAALDPAKQWTKFNAGNRTRQVEEDDFSSPRTIAASIDWLETNRKSGDWFLQVELFDPHEPFYCPKKYRDLYGDTWDGPLYDWPPYDVVKDSPEAVEHIRKCYAALLTMTDHWCGKLLAKLEELGLWDETLIVFTTDHGTMLGEREYWMKWVMPCYPEIAQIPLVIKPPGRSRPARVGQLTQTFDIMPTILDYYDCPLPPHVQGKSMRPIVEERAEQWREDILFGYFGMAINLTDGKHLYMRNPVRADGGPLHAYTSMPVKSLNLPYPRTDYDRMEMGRYLGHAYNMPLYKIPQDGRLPIHRPGEPSHLGKHELFTMPMALDAKAINDPKLEARFARRMAEKLQELNAPKEHIERLGL